MSGERTRLACLKSAMAEPAFNPNDDGAGDLRWRAGDEARAHYASLSAERKQQIEKEWNDGKI